ncbi:MerR family DNA-binding transcriptional regulator [Cupriavidus necator]|uniref:MerR family DNA-binding transcriptional regulator n=1 Tax=Cupriavidus necator TaxID=106590 RepID=A0A1U9V022_CUPNE|nr:IS607 family transposase [Cupriavidus necator]AQV98326.1 MerR family DNA-binding transcriptional regulator [Cupriavidus necator]
MSRKLVGIQEAATFLGVAAQTLRRWEREGRLVPDERTLGGRRRYDLSRLRPEQFRAAGDARRTVGYARVSGDDRKEDLAQQRQALALYCARQGWTFEVIADLGPGMDYHRPGLRRLLGDIIEARIGRLVITRKDRLLRLGAELVFALCEARNVEVVILNQGEDPDFEQELASDVLELIAVFSARLYGSRSHRSQTLLDDMRRAAENFRSG